MNSNQSLIVFGNSEISWPRPLRFWLLLSFDIPAIALSVMILITLIFNSTARSTLHNHTIIVLLILALIFQLIDVSWYLDFLRKSIVSPATPAHCLAWWFVDLGIYNTVSLILAWTSIERHILIFHDRWLVGRRQRFFIHYLPLILLLLYCLIYYTWVIFYPPCEHNYVYDLPVCSATPCHLLHPILSLWEMVVHGCLATLVITFSSVTLLIRVLWKRYHRCRNFRWRKHRKIIIQLLSISLLYLLFNLPIMIVWLIQTLGSIAEQVVHIQLITFFLTYWVMFLLPIVSLTSLSKLKKRLRSIFSCRSNDRIIPHTFVRHITLVIHR